MNEGVADLQLLFCAIGNFVSYGIKMLRESVGCRWHPLNTDRNEVKMHCGRAGKIKREIQLGNSCIPNLNCVTPINIV